MIELLFASNYYGSSYIKEDGGVFYYGTANFNGISFEEISESLFMSLKEFNDSIKQKNKQIQDKFEKQKQSKTQLQSFLDAGFIEIAKNTYARRSGVNGIDYIVFDGDTIKMQGYQSQANDNHYVNNGGYGLLNFLFTQAE